jgi:hypothetical protein
VDVRLVLDAMNVRGDGAEEEAGRVGIYDGNGAWSGEGEVEFETATVAREGEVMCMAGILGSALVGATSDTAMAGDGGSGGAGRGEVGGGEEGGSDVGRKVGRWGR